MQPSGRRTPKQIAGSWAESLAAAYLTDLGYMVLERNYRFGKHEIDLIVKNEESLIVFVEVKLRANNGLGFPEAAVSPAQIKSVHTAANYYLEQTPHNGHVRYDIIAITGNATQHELVHLQDAF